MVAPSVTIHSLLDQNQVLIGTNQKALQSYGGGTGREVGGTPWLI